MTQWCHRSCEKAKGLMSSELLLCARHTPGKEEVEVCLPSLGFALFSVGCSRNFSSGDRDLCMVGRVGSLNRMVSLPPVVEKGKMDTMGLRWHCDYIHPLAMNRLFSKHSPFLSQR